MPALPTVNAMYIKKIRDLLRTGIDYRTAQLSLGSGTSLINIQAQDPGAPGNTITVQVTIPSVTAGLTVSVSGRAITIALDQTNGTPNDPANTATLIAAAVNASAAASALVRAFLPEGSGAGSLSAAVAVTALAGGAQGSGEATIQTLPLNFLRAQDMSTVLELLQTALSQPGTMTALTGSSATLVQDGAGTFVPKQQIGNTVKFKSNTTTAALRGVTATILDNSDSALTVATLPAAVVNGDTYEIVASFVSSDIATLRQGKGLADAPPGNLFGDWRIVQNALTKITQRYGLVAASGLLTITTQPGDGDTVTINGKVYTFQTVLTNVNGNVLRGADAAASRDNLIAAINLGAGSGTAYAAATTLNADVRAVASGANVSVIAKVVGTPGNAITTTAVSTHVAWGGATLSGGSYGSDITVPTMATLTTGSGSTTTRIVTTRTDLRIDQFKEMKLTINGVSAIIRGNDETSLFITGGLSAPASSQTITITARDGVFDRVHPGGQPANNKLLALAIAQAEAAVVAYVLPT